MALISINQLHIGFRGPDLLEGVDCRIDRGEKIERPQRYISHIADWRGDDIEPWAQFRCRFTSQGHLN